MSLHTTPSPLVEKKVIFVHCVSDEPHLTTATPHLSQKLRTFSPVILFHDHHYVNAGSGDLQHVHIPYGDPSYGRHLDSHKKRIHEMLQTNGRYWLDIITWTRGKQKEAEREKGQETKKKCLCVSHNMSIHT